jgi:hypothetical protein
MIKYTRNVVKRYTAYLEYWIIEKWLLFGFIPLYIKERRAE